jgi:hypothetical protein
MGHGSIPESRDTSCGRGGITKSAKRIPSFPVEEHLLPLHMASTPPSLMLPMTTTTPPFLGKVQAEMKNSPDIPPPPDSLKSIPQPQDMITTSHSRATEVDSGSIGRHDTLEIYHEANMHYSGLDGIVEWA